MSAVNDSSGCRPPAMPDVKGVVLGSASQFMASARRLYHEIPAGLPDRARAEGRGLAVIILATVATEAFINELGGLAAMTTSPGSTDRRHSPAIVKLAGTLHELEARRRSPVEKYAQALNVLRPPEGSGQQDDEPLLTRFRVLVETRNGLVHAKPPRWLRTGVTIDGEEEGRLDVEQVRETLAPLELLVLTDIPEVPLAMLIDTRAAARWALDTAARVIRVTIAAIPPSALRNTFAHVDVPKSFAGVEDLASPNRRA
jgi:hypothetical protein